MRLPNDLESLLADFPTAEDWRDHLGLSRVQYGRLRYFTIDPKELRSSTLRGMHAGCVTYDHPYGSLIVSVGDDLVLRYIGNNSANFTYQKGLDMFQLSSPRLPHLTRCDDAFLMLSTFEDITAIYGDACGLEFDGTRIVYNKDNGLLRRSEWLPSFRCKPFYGEREFRDKVFEKNLKGFRPSFANLF